MPQYHILHASDLHLTVNHSRVGLPEIMTDIQTFINQRPRANLVSTHDPLILEAFVQYAYENCHDYDVILLSGDLATTGSDEDLSLAKQVIDSRPVDLYFNEDRLPTLSACKKEIALIPGNHDRFGLSGNSLDPQDYFPPGNASFDTVFENYWSVGQGADVIWACEKEGTRLVLIGADFTLRAGDDGESILGHFGRGRADRERIEMLREATQKVKVRFPSCAIIWVIHFTPDARNDLLRLLDESALHTAAQEEQIPAILCGHTHMSSRSALASSTEVFICGTTTQYWSSHGNFFHLMDIDISPSSPSQPQIQMRRFRFEPDCGQFVSAPFRRPFF